MSATARLQSFDVDTGNYQNGSISTEHLLFSANDGTSGASSSKGAPDDAIGNLANRQAARRNASSISEADVGSLRDERRALLQRKYDVGLTNRETRRLAFVRWSLDRVDDARDGEALDKLEGAAALYQKVGQDFHALLAEFHRSANRSAR